MISKRHKLCYTIFGDLMEIMKFVLGDIRSNCYILHNNQQAVVIDPGYESDEVVEWLKDRNLIIEAIYITHGHFDHCGGVKHLKSFFDAPVYAPVKDRIWFDLTPYNRLGYQVPIDVWVSENDTFYWLDQTFTIFDSPGHSEGGTVLYNGQVLFAGDTLFYQSIGRTDIPFASTETIYQSIKKLYRLFPDQTVVYPGHGRPTTIGHEKQFNPFVRS